MQKCINIYCQDLFQKLSITYRVKIDIGAKNFGFKVNHWETAGVPLQLRIGKKELDNHTLFCVTRYNRHKFTTTTNDINDIFVDIENNMYNTAKLKLENSIIQITKLDDIIDNKINLSAFCGDIDCEKYIKKLKDVKTICLPTAYNNAQSNDYHCIGCQKTTNLKAMFSKTF